MENIPGYTALTFICETGDFAVYRALKEGEHGREPVLLKVPAAHRPLPAVVRQLEHEYEVTRKLDPELIVRPIRLERHANKIALVLENGAYQALEEGLGAPMEIKRFLKIAIGAAAALAEIHRHDLVHKDIKPQNILLDEETGKVRITGLGIASRLPQVPQAVQVPGLLEGTLAYMSPEQTGRMNRVIDCRTDFYSLGVTFYQMLTGSLPFHAGDLLEWVHCHIARFPPSPSTLVAQIPEMVSEIVMKLLAKVAEARYQSAAGLRFDLEKCLALWESTGRMDRFVLGEHDIPDRFQIPQKLYGREAEAAKLLSAFDRVAVGGEPEIVMISGYAGIGKSALVQELHKPIVSRRGFFISGKFDQVKRDIPYSTIVLGFRQLIHQILAESEERVGVWKEQLQAALGSNGQLIVDLMPEVEWIIGKQPPTIELPPSQAQHRFHTVFQNFLHVFAKAEHPLALFLDDLQWIDPASLQLLKYLLTDPDTRYLLLVGAYRDNEVSASHPLTAMMAEICKTSLPVCKIVLGPFFMVDLKQFVADALHCSPERSGPLAQLVHEKTGSNPFFAIQFLSALYQDRLVFFDSRGEVWRWDIKRIQEQRYTDNIVDFMIGKLARLPDVTQSAMQVAACIGHEGAIHTLALICGKSETETLRDLWEAICEGLILAHEKGYRFLHDRVQQAAYALIPESRRRETHLRIGTILLSHTPPQEMEENIFDIVNQLNLGGDLITKPGEKYRAAELNLLAGKKAKGSTAYAAATIYFSAGSKLLPADSWKTHYALAYALCLQRAECDYLSGNLSDVEMLLTDLLPRALGSVDKARIHRLRMALHTTLGNMEQAIEYGIEGMRLFGMELPSHPTRAEVEAEYSKVWEALGNRPIADLINQPLIENEEFKMAMSLLSDLGTPAIFARQNLLHLTTAKMVGMSIQRGNVDASVRAYAWFGATLVQRDIAKYREGWLFGKLAYDLMERHGLLEYKATVCLIFGDNTNFYLHHFRTDRDYIHAAFAAGVENGDLPYACYSCNHIITNMLKVGDPLSEVWEESVRRIAFIRKAKDPNIEDIIVSQQRFILNLRGLTARFSTFSGDGFSEEDFEARIKESQMQLMVCWYYILKLQARFIFNCVEDAVAAAEISGRLIATSGPDIQGADYDFFAALAKTAHYHSAPPERQKKYLEELSGHLKLLRDWADNCPENFLNRYALVSAEEARIKGLDLDAMRLYEQAILSARENGFVQNEGIANELAARFYQERGFETIARTYLREALYCYVRWGADGKVKQLEERHPWLRVSKPLEAAATIATPPEQVDMMTVVKAQQAISGEIVIDHLVETLLRIVLENAGAQKAYLFVEPNAKLFAVTQPDKADSPVEFHRAPMASTTEISLSILNYVKRTRETVLLSDASADAGEFSADEYLLRTRPKSVLCMPIVHQAKLSGILYLENNLVAGAFTPDRRVLLGMLASQAAISLETALLYSDLQESKNDLQNQTRILQSILDSMGDGVLVSNERGELLMFNPAAEKILGTHVTQNGVAQWPQQYGLYLPDQTTPYPAGELPLVKAMRGESVDGAEIFVQHPGREEGIWLRVSARPLTDKSGIARGGVAVFADFTAHKQAEGNLRQAKETAEAANLAKDKFFAMLSHELRTPLTPILSGINTLAEESAGESLATLEMMRRNLVLESRIIDDLLDLTRITKGKLAVEMEPLEAHQMIRDALETCRLQVAHLQTVLALDAPHHTVTGDKGRLQQVVRNLLQNAARFTPKGGHIEIRTSNPAPGMFRLICRDTGMGIDPGDLTRIFTAFEQSDRFVRGGYGGLGLGLAISKALVEAQGGTITARSAGRGLGAIFEVTLHTASAAAALPGSEPSPVAAPPVPAAARPPLRILLVEDHTDTRQMLERLLKRSGYQVDTAANARTAREHARNKEFDLFISDIGLPDGSGLDLVRAIHQHQALPSIALSGFGTESDLRQSREAGFAEHLVKPVDFKRLRETIERLRRA